MDDLRLQAVAARVVAWHNRHPLARRITAAQVKSVGYVGFGAPAAAVTPHAAPHAVPVFEPPADVAAQAPPPAAEPREEDFAQAFAELAEQAAADERALAATVVEAAAAEASEPSGFEIELDVTPEQTEALPEAAATGSQQTAVAQDVAVSPVQAPASKALPSLRDRALTRAQQAPVTGALLATHEGYAPTAIDARSPAAEFGWSESHFMAPLSLRQVARWVERHGRRLLQAPQDGPLRRVTGAAMTGSEASGAVFVMTAAIDGGALRSRLLIGAGDHAPVLGPRLWSLPRVLAAGIAAALLLVGLGVAAALLMRKPQAAVQAVAPAAASVPASVPASTHASAPASSPEAAVPAEEQGHVKAHAETHTDTHAKTAAPAASQKASAPPLIITTQRPALAYAQKGVLALPSRGSPLSEEDKAAARQAVAAARAAAGVRAALAPVPVPVPVAAAAAAPGPVPAAEPTPAPAARPAAPLPTGPVFAVSTRALRTRAEAEQLKVAMAALLGVTGSSGMSLEMLPEGDDWRVVAWPYTSQSEADRARALLSGRGMRVEVLKF